MSTVEVKSATSIRASGPNWTTLYTVPAGKQAVVRTVTATNTAQTSVTLSPSLGLRRSGTVTRLSIASIAASTSASDLKLKITAASGYTITLVRTLVAV
jgi:hypothetical protein